jgi:hypothetical protein
MNTTPSVPAPARSGCSAPGVVGQVPVVLPPSTRAPSGWTWAADTTSSPAVPTNVEPSTVDRSALRRVTTISLPPFDVVWNAPAVAGIQVTVVGTSWTT